MSCTSVANSATVASPCGFQGVPDPANEPLASALTNFTNLFFGPVTKTLVDGAVVWSLPCDLSTGVESNPRVAGEGLACYFLRLLQEGAVTLEDGYLKLPSLTDPPVEVPGHGQLYVLEGELFYRSPNGTITSLAPS